MTVPRDEKATARMALRALNPRSIAENVEWGVVLYRIAARHGTTAPFTSGMKDGIDEDRILRAIDSRPKGSAFVALAHTHARDENGTFTELFSPEDIETAQRFGVNAYLATPSGQLVIFDRTGPPGFFPREAL